MTLFTQMVHLQLTLFLLIMIGLVLKRRGIIVSNSSFIGIPIIHSLYGAAGVLYTSFFQIPVRITMWSSGLALFTDVDRKDAYKKLAKHPCIIAVFIGVILMAADISFPVFLENTLDGISKCMVPVSMIAIGAMLAEADVRQMFDKAVLYYCLIRLIVYPLMILCVLRLFRIESVLCSTMVLLSAMPMASTTAILADKYGCNPKIASQTIFVSTLISIVTLPVMMAAL